LQMGNIVHRTVVEGSDADAGWDARRTSHRYSAGWIMQSFA